MINTIRLMKDDVIRITGPARIEVKEGRILVAGATYGRGESLIIHKFRSYGIMALEETLINAILGEGAEIAKTSLDEEVIGEWLGLAKGLLADYLKIGGARILVIGPIESGKTSLTAFIANYFLQNGIEPSIIEADIGQEDLAIPGTVAYKKIRKKFLWQRELGFESIRFVGCISPSLCGDKVVTAVIDLINKEKLMEPLIINTDGWVNTQAALLHKLELVRWIRPTHIVVTGVDAYKLFQSALGNYRVLYAQPSKNKAIRDREIRRQLRRESYIKYFTEGSVRQVDLGAIDLLNSIIFAGKPLNSDELGELLPCFKSEGIRVLYASIYKEYLNLIVAERDQSLTKCLPPKESGFRLRVYTPQDYVGCLVGLVGEDFVDAGVGKILGIRFLTNSVNISILTPYEGVIRGLIAGKIKLKDDFQEVRGDSVCAL